MAGDLLTSVRTHLIAAGIVRNPRTNAPDLPPMFLAPKQGAVRAPGEPESATGNLAIEVGRDAVVAAQFSVPIPTGPFGKHMERPVVEFLVRSLSAQYGITLGGQIRAALNDRRGYSLGGLWVEESLEQLGFRPVPDDQVFRFHAEYEFVLHL